MAQDVRDRVARLDLSLFAVPTATGDGDRQTLLRLQQIVARRTPYRYLEIGSESGGTLLPHLIHPDCERVVSIDKRPDSQPDERAQRFSYRGMTTEVMRQTLRQHVSEIELGKLVTFDADASELTACDTGLADLALIDGEHTNTACFSDFASIREALAADAVVAFHDANLVTDAILNVERDLQARRVMHRLFFLPDQVAVIALRDSVRYAAEVLGPLGKDRERYIRESRIQRWEEVARSVAAGDHLGV